MAIDPNAAAQEAQKLNMVSAGQVSTGVTEALSGPAIAEPEIQVAGGGFAGALGGAFGRIIGGPEVESGRRMLGERRQRETELTETLEQYPKARVRYKIRKLNSDEDGFNQDAPWALIDEADGSVRQTFSDRPQAQAARKEIYDRPDPEPIVGSVVGKPAFTLSPEALDKRVLEQAAPIRSTEVEANDALMTTLEPRRTELVSDGLTDFTAVGSRGDAKIPDEGSVLALIEHTSLTHKLEVDEATRGIIRHEVSQELADYLGTNPRKIMAAVMNMRTTGGVPIVEGSGISETILAVRNLLYTEVSKLDALADKAIGMRATPEDLLNFRQQFDVVSNLQTNFKGIQTEIGRSLGIFRVPVDQASQAYKDINLSRILDEFGGAGDVLHLAQAYAALPTGAKRVQFTKVSGFRKFTNAAFEVWINGLLSGPISHTKNFVAAGLTVFGELPVHMTAAAIGTARRALGGEGGQSFGEVRAMMFGQMMAMREAAAAAGTSFRTGEVPIAGSKLGDATRAGDRRTKAFSAEAFGMSRATATGNVLAAGVDAIGSFLTLGRIPTRALGFEDTFWKVVAQRGNLWQQAFRAAKEQNKSGEDAARFMSDFMADPPAAAVKEADDLARKLTLQAPLESRLGRWVQTGARIGFMRWFIPFVKTPYNAFTFAFEHTPLAFRTKAWQDAMASGDRAKMDVAFARAGLGSVAGIAIGSMTAAGQITGGGPKDYGLRQNLIRQGWQPYSVLINGTYYSYAGAEPFSTVVGLVADAVELVQTGVVDQDEADEILTAVTFALAKNMSNKTFMQGFSNFMNALTEGDRYGARIANSFARSATPLISAGITRQVGRSMDPYRRDPVEFEAMPSDFAELPMEVQQANSAVLGRYSELAWLNSRLGEIKAAVPGWGDAPAYRDLWGRKVANEGGWGPDVMSPIYMSATAGKSEMEIDGVTYDTGALDQEMTRLKISEPGHPDDYPGFPLNAAERDFFQERAGMHAVIKLSELLNDPAYAEDQQIGRLQRHDSVLNKKMRLDILLRLTDARELALQDLMSDAALGQDFVDSQEQYELLLDAVHEKSEGAVQ